MSTTQLRELAEAATPGPWISAGPSFGAEFPVYCNEVVVDRDGDEDDTYGICQAPTCLEEKSTHDMNYIAAASPAAILALLDRIKELEDELRACVGSLDYVERTFPMHACAACNRVD